MADRPPATGGPRAAAANHHLFGFTVKSDFGFTRPLPPANGDPELLFTRASGSAAQRDWLGHEPVFRSPLLRDGESVSSLYRLGGREILHFDGEIDFEMGEQRIEYLAAPELDWLVELRFLGPVMSYWMERRGLICLHASAVAFGDRAALFLAAGGGGKTTLAAALLAAGHALLSDDIAALEERGGSFLARPGYPEMRMWPATAKRFLNRWEDLPLAHPGLEKLRAAVAPGRLGHFRDEPLPLAGLYLLDKRPASAAVEISAVDQRPAVIELVARSFSPHLVQAAGLQPERLDRFARLVAAVPVRRLAYPEGHDHLPAVAAAVGADLKPPG